MSSQSALQHLVRTFHDALAALDCEVPPAELERWSVEVHYAMSAGGRWFHTIEHVFEIIDGACPIQVLAGLFHDTVYLQVDGGIPRRLEERLGDLLGDHHLHFAHDRTASRVAAIFGLSEGAPLDEVVGLNEYLSAVFAARCLAGHAPESVIWPVVACIELTIPFRPEIDGLSAALRLRERLERTVVASDAELDEAIAWAQELANRDVGNFASDDHAWFLDNTWKLLPESHAGLRDSVYTIGEYAYALESMRRFFCQLDPDVVFGSFAGSPTRSELDRMRGAAVTNLAVGRRYLDAKLLAASVLGALADRTGGDAPISLFMGDLPSLNPTTPCLDHYLPAGEAPVDGDPLVYELLSAGRATHQGFDLRNSPLAAWLYGRLGQQVHGLVDELVLLPETERPDFVLRHTLTSIEPVIRATAELAVTRRDQLLALIA